MEEVLLLFYPKQNILSFALNKEKDNFWLSYKDRTFCIETESFSGMAMEVQTPRVITPAGREWSYWSYFLCTIYLSFDLEKVPT